MELARVVLIITVCVNFLFFSKMCFRAWQHDVKLELLNKKKERRIVQKHYVIWKKRISLNTIASEMVRIWYFEVVISFFMSTVRTLFGDNLIYRNRRLNKRTPDRK